jgi:hypothetical protein
MPTATSSDPIRAEVERRLTAVAETMFIGPMERLGRLARIPFAPCRFVRSRLAEPIAVVRSIGELAFGRRPEPAPGSRPDKAARTPPVRRVSPADRSAVAPVDVVVPVSVATDIDVDVDDLPIADYESLAASQVVARLDDLPAADLARIREFESAHRGRRTVLGKVDLLLATR